MFKSDSVRLAFAACFEFCVYSTKYKLGHCVPHTLTGR
ncbi:DUF3265 domain-containing protein [Vibrio parahaemolyticus]|nr:DUF3265 domain-containing protein [Vibrio parahaemolyticus]EGQ9522566.1 DUF3265 domain-containing protein [Vibrio parahaemolyticus]EGR3406332.1 DUF3265 domain-containing protein [Vibrio parahaemolyticus]